MLFKFIGLNIIKFIYSVIIEKDIDKWKYFLIVCYVVVIIIVFLNFVVIGINNGVIYLVGGLILLFDGEFYVVFIYFFLLE